MPDPKRARGAGAGSSSRLPQQIRVSALKGVSIRFEGDVFDLGRWLLHMDLARSSPTCKPRHTVHGLASRFSYLTGMDLEEVRQNLAGHGLPLGATIERDEDVA